MFYNNNTNVTSSAGRFAGEDDPEPYGTWISAAAPSAGRYAGEDDPEPYGTWIPASAPAASGPRAVTPADYETVLNRYGFMPGRSIEIHDNDGNEVQFKTGFDPYEFRKNRDALPTLSDFFNTFNQSHLTQYNKVYDRPWAKQGETGLRDQLVKQYTDAIGEYNQLYGTNYIPNQQSIAAFSQAPTNYAANDWSARKSGSFKDFLKFAAPIALSAFGGPMISGALGGGIGGAVGAGTITGGLKSAIQGTDFLEGALRGSISGGLNAGASTALNNLTGGSGMFDFGNIDLSSQFDDVGGGFDVGSLDVGGESLPFTMGNMGYGPEGSAGIFPTIQNDLDMFSQLQPNFGGPGYPSGEGLPAGWAQALSQAGLVSPNGGDFMSQVQKFLTDPKNLMRGGGALANMLIQNRTANKLTSAADRAAFLNQSLNQTQRFPYQAMLSDQMSNPSAFFQTNPVVQAKLEQAKRQFEANTAKMGAGGKVFSDYLNSMNASMADTYYKNADLLSRLGGFSDGPGNAGSIYGDLSGKAAQASGAGFQGFSQFFNPQREDPQLEQLRRQISEKINQIFL